MSDTGPELKSIDNKIDELPAKEEEEEEENLTLVEEEGETELDQAQEEKERKEREALAAQRDADDLEEKKSGFNIMDALSKIKTQYSVALIKISKKPHRVAVVQGKKKLLSQKRGSSITFIPPLTDPLFEERSFYPVKEPYTYVRILFNNGNNEFIYDAIEPQLDKREEEFLEYMKDSLHKTLGYDWEAMGEKDKRSYIKDNFESLIGSRGVKIDDDYKDKLLYYIIRDFVGYGPIDVLMDDENVEDISCDGTNVPLFVYHRDMESIKTNVAFPDEKTLDSFTIYLGQRCGKQVSVSVPILDGTTAEGHRVQAAYSTEVTTRGSAFTIRRYKEKPFTPVDIILHNSASNEMMAYLWVAIENGESGIIAGGTASGKTATLNAMMLFISPSAKVVSIEDTREINLPLENWIPGVTRSGVGEKGVDGKAPGEIDMYELVRAALRQRPNYIMVGEVRGKETYTMFQAMATGHTTYSTMHADSVKSMVHRLENPPINCPRILLTALNIVIIQKHARVGKQIVRRIFEIVEIVGFEPETNDLITNTVYEWDQPTDTFHWKGHSFLFDKIQEMKGITTEDMKREHLRRVHIVKYMVYKKMNNFEEVGELVSSYYKESDETYERVRDMLKELDDEALLEMDIPREELSDAESILDEAEDDEGALFGGGL